MSASRKNPPPIKIVKSDVSVRHDSIAGAQDIEKRKEDHIEIILSGQARNKKHAGFDDYQFEHCALPDINFDQIDLSVEFLGKRLKLPYLASSMTGGPAKSATINLAIAQAAQELGFAMGVGSQRIALGGGGDHGIDFSIRKVAPDILLFANLGAVQLAYGMGQEDVRRAMDMIEADALILHLNPLQEAIQLGGDRNWKGVATAIETVCKTLGRPVIAKEVGAGISAKVAKRLIECGISAIDVAGTGGSSWAAVEGKRIGTQAGTELGDIFRDWGISTVNSLLEIHREFASLPLIASGGIRNGLDGAKAIAMGASLVGQAGALLPAAIQGPELVIDHVNQWSEALRIACFATDCLSVTELRNAALLRHIP